MVSRRKTVVFRECLDPLYDDLHFGGHSMIDNIEDI
jgi:hypothetical protein